MPALHQDHKPLMYSKLNSSKDSTIFSTECKESRLISKTNILLPTETIAVVLAKGSNTPSTSRTKDNIANIIANPFLCIESPSLYRIPTVCIFPEKEVNRMCIFVVNLGHDEVKIMKGHTLVHLTPDQYDSFSDTEERNQESKIANISIMLSENID